MNPKQSPSTPLRVRKGPVRRPVIQVAGQLVALNSDAKRAADTAIAAILDWLEVKQGIVLPKGAREGGSFEVDASETHPVTAVRFDEFWAVQYDKLDPDVGGRIWRTEATVAYQGDLALAGVRLAVIDSGQPVDFNTSIPAVVADLIRSPGLVDGDGTYLDHRPRILDTERAVNEWLALARSPHRTHPILAFSSTWQFDASDEATLAAARLAGLAHVVIFPERESRLLTQKLGKDFSVWNGAVRTYNPGFDPTADEIRQHPLATRDWLQRKFKRPEHFISAVRHSMAARSVRADNLEEELPAFRSIKQASFERRLDRLEQGSSAEREKLLSSQVELYKQRESDLVAQYEYADEEVKQVEAERDQYRAVVMALRAQNDRYQALLAATSKPLAYPKEFDSLDTWVEENLPGRVLLLTRAIRAARKSPFADRELVYRSLERLAFAYVDARRSGAEVANLFEDIGVHLERTGDEDHLKNWKDHYFVVHRGQTRFFDWHLKKGADKSDTNTMRIYFFYDEDDEQVVVGYLPGHLPNAKT